MKIDPVHALVKQRVGHWGEAILHLGARRAESSTRLRNDEVGGRWQVGSFNPRTRAWSSSILVFPIGVPVQRLLDKAGAQTKVRLP